MKKALKSVRNLLPILMVGMAMSSAAEAEILYSTGEVQLHYGDGYILGANGFDETSRSTLTVEQFTLHNWGDFYYFVDLYHDNEGTGRATDHYSEVWAHMNGGNFGFEFPEGAFVKDVGPGIGLNHGTDFLVVVPGVRASLNIPGFNFFTLGAYAYETFDDPYDRSLDTTYQLSAVWDKSFKLGKENFAFRGFADWIGSQGSGVDNRVIVGPQLVWDVGNEGGVSVGVEYAYFQNKYGVTGVDENSVSLFVASKF